MTSEALSTNSPTADRAAAGEWQAVHIYYAANPQPMLVGCIGPLIEELRHDGLLAGHFFINYWLEGPHVRLRLRPTDAGAADEVRRRTEAAVQGFLRRRPALYHVESGFLDELYNTLFDMEVEDIDRAAHTGADGRMNLQPNNTYRHVPYEPEYGKYGGPAGVELAEWHFQHSSDLVIEAVRTLNLHLRTVVLGTAAQLMMVMSTCFLPDREQLVDYLDSYHAFWHKAFSGTDLVGRDAYAASSLTTAGLGDRFGLVRETVANGATERLPGFLAGWAEHAFELRDRVDALATRGDLVLRSWDGQRDEPVTDPADARVRLLSPYLHMTNNRLHVTIRDEAYLSFLLAESLRDPSHPERTR
jgi:Lantibiotic biosynthesis dehydratase C-term